MDDFDYLNSTFSEWLEENYKAVPMDNISMIYVLENQYLPNFEAAIWRRASVVQ
jgi:hypothetical protein